jgi:hypothetical protein
MFHDSSIGKYLLSISYCGICVILSMVICISLAAQEVSVPAKLQTELFLNVLAFDRNHRAIPGKITTIAVVFQAHFRRSLECKDEVFLTLANKPGIKIVSVDIENGFLQEIEKIAKPEVLIVCPLRSADIDEITAYSRKEHVLTTTLVSKYLEEGLSVCVQVEQDRPIIVMNLTAARMENADFDFRLLKFIRTFNP